MKLTQRTRNDMTQNINLFDAATLEILRKFNANKNAEALANDLEPGTYERTITVTISGSLTKAAPKVTRPRDRKGVSHIVHWALDRMTDAEFSALLRASTARRAAPTLSALTLSCPVSKASRRAP